MKPIQTGLAGLGALVLAISITSCSDNNTPTYAPRPIVVEKKTIQHTSFEIEPSIPEEVEVIDNVTFHVDRVEPSEPTKPKATPIETAPTPVVVEAPPVRLSFNRRYTALIQIQGDTQTQLNGPLDFISCYATYRYQGQKSIAIFGGSHDLEENAILDFYVDKNRDGIWQADEKVKSFDLGPEAEVPSATFLRTGELLYVDLTSNKVLRIRDSDGDKAIDTLAAEPFWGAFKDDAFLRFEDIRAESLKRVSLRNPRTGARYVIKDDDQDGQGDSGEFISGNK